MELRCHASYSGLHYPIAYWRTASGFEVDFVLADGAVAVEAKATERPSLDHMRELRALREETRSKRSILVCRAPRARKTEDGIEILPWSEFLRQLWAGESSRSIECKEYDLSMPWRNPAQTNSR
jgi:predicted AAA+ superfamily ATPase